MDGGVEHGAACSSRAFNRQGGTPCRAQISNQVESSSAGGRARTQRRDGAGAGNGDRVRSAQCGWEERRGSEGRAGMVCLQAHTSVGHWVQLRAPAGRGQAATRKTALNSRSGAVGWWPLWWVRQSTGAWNRAATWLGQARRGGYSLQAPHRHGHGPEASAGRPGGVHAQSASPTASSGSCCVQTRWSMNFSGRSGGSESVSNGFKAVCEGANGP